MTNLEQDEQLDLKAAKISRRAAKAALTRVGKALIYQLEHKRPSDEVRECLGKLKSVFDNLLSKHEGFAKTTRSLKRKNRG